MASETPASSGWCARFLHARAMVRAGLAAEQEALLCHRATTVLLDTMVVCGHPCVTGATAAQAADGERVVHAYGSLLVDAAACAAVDWERTTSNGCGAYHAWASRRARTCSTTRSARWSPSTGPTSTSAT